MISKMLFEGNIGAEGSYKIELIEANVVASVMYDGADMTGEAKITIKTKAGLAKLKKLIPGEIDDAIIDMLEKYLLS